MYINVVSEGFDFFCKKRISCLKYNMRMNSQRSYWGTSDREDLEKIIEFFHNKIQKKIIPIGYSYGSVIASSLQSNQHVKSFVSISYPFGVAWVLGVYYLKEHTISKDKKSYWIAGNKDMFTSFNSFKKNMLSYDKNLTDYEILNDVDHFWMDKEKILFDKIFDWIEKSN
eukprot:TRINITY_DN8240_c0_g1_i1.p1 TRINITY_DN8240_c0_g1~~TRINITY_DN8240_c0_g1_i1.p1  ORF type:complete len:170 (-),score=45.15 TRINITY_DN8240_c0_g1_i1:6-515(-)